ncbi:ice-binding family protein [Sphaerisporangium sp. NPDC049002]|uniref:ice-binding family protein n=1 Tax=unclassified Sphaerisporangium TaxID=2630420 RepID=UPI003411F562
MLAAALPAMVAMGVVVATPHAASAQAAPVALGAASTFGVLAGTTVTNTGATVVTGDLGVSPGTAVTGFPPGTITGARHAGDPAAAAAQVSLTAAYNDAASRTPATTVPTELGGTTLTPGVYNSASGTFQITGKLTLDAQGDPNAVFIFQTASTLVTASASTVTLVNGASPCNIFWQVGSSATLGTNSSFAGNILALTSITVTTGVTVNGRVLARNGAVTLDTDAITVPACPVVTIIPTTTTVTSSCATPGSQGKPITLTVTVRTARGTIPTGQVIFTSDGVSLGTMTLNASGQATLKPNLAEGARRIVASYLGTATLSPSHSAPLVLRVGPDSACPKCVEKAKEGAKEGAENAEPDKTLLNHRGDREHHHRKHGRLVTVQTLHTLHGVIHEGGGGGHHSTYHAGSGHHPVHHKVHYKAHKKPRVHHHYYKPRPHAGVTG